MRGSDGEGGVRKQEAFGTWFPNTKDGVPEYHNQVLGIEKERAKKKKKNIRRNPPKGAGCPLIRNPLTFSLKTRRGEVGSFLLSNSIYVFPHVRISVPSHNATQKRYQFSCYLSAHRSITETCETTCTVWEGREVPDGVRSNVDKTGPKQDQFKHSHIDFRYELLTWGDLTKPRAPKSSSPPSRKNQTTRRKRGGDKVPLREAMMGRLRSSTIH